MWLSKHYSGTIITVELKDQRVREVKTMNRDAGKWNRRGKEGSNTKSLY